MPKSKQPVSHMKFAEAWQKSTSVGDVAKAFGITLNAARVRAYQLRQSGVKLKKYPNKKKPIDAKTINRAIKAAFGSKV